MQHDDDAQCDRAREAASATIDGEAGPLSEVDLRRHLDTCRACADWYASAVALTRRARIGAVDRPSDLVPRVLAAADATDLLSPRRGGADRRRLLARVALVVVALAQLAVAVPVLVLGHDHTAPMHVAHELGALDAAIAVGLLVAARRPHLATGMLPLVGVAAALLGATALADLATASTDPVDELPHVLDVVGFLLLWSVTPTSRRSPAPELRMPRRRAA